MALLHYVDGLTQERIAQELDWSRRTVGKKIRELEERAQRLKRRSQHAKSLPISANSSGLSMQQHADEEVGEP